MMRQLFKNKDGRLKKIRTGLLVLLQCFIAGIAVASEDPPQISVFKGRNGEIDTGYVRETTDMNYYNGTIFSAIQNPANDVYTNTISLLIDEDTTMIIPADFTVTVIMNIIWTNMAGTEDSITGRELRLTYKKGAGTIYDARNYFIFDNARKVKVRITGVDKDTSTWDVTQVLLLENRLVVRRDYDFECTTSVEGVDNVPGEPSAIETIDEITVTWENPSDVYGITHNDIEWTWVDYEALDRYKTGGVFDADLIFKNNSSRVTIPASDHFTIPLLYDGNGYFFYRVRPVQYLENGQVVEGAWSETGDNYYHYENGYEPDFNWQVSTVFAEDGKYMSVVSFFDGTQRSRQTVTKDNTTHTTIVGETWYDFQGRPAINILPAPTISTVIEYAKNFNKFSYGTDPKDIYDLATGETVCSVRTPYLDSTTGASKYYSSNNELVNTGFHKYIPSAFGFPYTETRYTPDGTGRIAAQGGVGPDHQLNTGHETKYFYGSAEQKELDALFGTQVGNKSHYFKNMIRDANGQYSVNYVDMGGRTIATALAGNYPENLDSLPSHKKRFITKDLLAEGSNTVKGRSVESATTLLVPIADSFDFHYDVSPESAEIAACNPEGQPVCYNCYYDLEIRIVGECGDPIVINARNFSFGEYDTSCAEGPPPFLIDTTIWLTEGEYNITKTLKLSQHAQDYYRDSIYSLTNICKTLQQYYEDNYDVMIANSNCNMTCESCHDSLGSYDNYRNKFLVDLGLDPGSDVAFEAEIQASYDEAKAACIAFCDTSTVENRLTTIRQMMIDDMTPDMGQYAQTDDDVDQPFNTRKPFNIFNTKPAYPYPTIFGSPVFDFAAPPPVPAFTHPQNADGTTYYKDETGAKDPIMNPNPPVEAFSHEEFTRIFKPHWAESLLPHHPEYNKLQYAETYLKTSYAFDERMENTPTWDEAVAAGYLNMTTLLTTDPFFAGVGNSFHIPGPFGPIFFLPTYKERMEDWLTDNYAGGRPMWQVAWVAVNCMSDDINNCASGAPSTIPTNPSDCEEDWNKVWVIFRTAYLAEKDKMINSLLKWEFKNEYLDRIFETNGYQRRFISTDGALSTSDVPGDMDAELEASYEQSCEGYIEMWKSQLDKCDLIAEHVDREAILTEITIGLKAVCKRGSDIDHPFGSSTVRPDERGTDPVSFEQVIETVLAAHSIPITAACHPYLINYPQPYEYQSPVSDDVMLQTYDSCVCKRLTELQTEKKQKWGDAGTLSQFIAYQHGVTIRESLLDSLDNGCKGVFDCVFYETALPIPAILDCQTPINNCIDCGQYDSLKRKFAARHPGIDSVLHADPQTDEHVNENNMFAQYMNSQTGFRKTWIDYLQFELLCKGDTLSCDSLQRIVNHFYQIHGDSLYGDSCETLFTTYINSVLGTSYTYTQIRTLFMQYCGSVPEVCRPEMDCPMFQQVIDSFYVRYGESISDSTDCKSLFTDHFNDWLGTDYTWEELDALFQKLCGKPLDICNPIRCIRLQEVLDTWKSCNRSILLDSTCITQWVTYFNAVMFSSFSEWQIDSLYRKCQIPLTPCQPSINCQSLNLLLQSYYNLGDSACRGSGLDTAATDYCYDCFTWYINDQLGTHYSYEQVVLLFKKNCGTTPMVCQQRFQCKLLMVFNLNFTQWYPAHAGDGRCDSLFVDEFNDHFGTSYISYEQVSAVYQLYCGSVPAICDTATNTGGSNIIVNCLQIEKVYKDFKTLYPEPVRYFGDSCQSAYTKYFNAVFGSSLTFTDITKYYRNLCNTQLDVCLEDTCLNLQNFLIKYNTLYGSYNLPKQLCRDLFTKLFNAEFKPKEAHTWYDIAQMYADCGDTLEICPDSAYTIACENLTVAKKAFYAFYNGRVAFNCSETFTRFFNLYFGTSFTDYEQLDQWAKDNCSDTLNICGKPIPRITQFLRSAVSVTPPPSVGPRLCDGPILPQIDTTETDPCDFVGTMSLNSATEQYNVYVQQQYDKFDSIYLDKCIKSVPPETFTVSGHVSEYHFTLYYYDQAGNLVKTIPPQGVDERRLLEGRIDAWHDSVKAARISGEALPLPQHTLATEYRYNTLDQLIALKSPDGGLRTFYYDRLGRLVLSQNAKQESEGQYSYTKYDDIGRITEVGQISGPGITQELTQDQTDLENWFDEYVDAREQITTTVYDIPANIICVPGNTNTLCQANLRNRISYTTLTDIAGENYASASYFSYDIHGAIDTLLQHYAKGIMNDVAGNAFKKMVWQYDLISGKVNEVAYQPGLKDEFYHRYEYDATNRVTEVYTSHDHVYWERQAKHDYYKHGPLVRIEIGQLGVQGIDYAYNLQGWFKGVNSSAIGDNYDMGVDGPVTNRTAKDVFSFSLNYYDATDYKAIKPSTYPFATIPYGPTPDDGVEVGVSLFSGNITSMLVNIPKVGEAHLYAYRYDQLNRLKGMNAYTGLDTEENSFTPLGIDKYKERVTYDANGNILSYMRNGDSPVEMDNLTYSYKSGSNQLDHVDDVGGYTGNYAIDIDDQEEDNYGYDAIGNLIRDDAEHIESITWTVYGKIASIVKNIGGENVHIDYTYDAMGNRISKKVQTEGEEVVEYTWYVRDANGNIMAVYQRGFSALNGGQLTQSEIHLYGTSRLGLWKSERNVETEDWWLFEIDDEPMPGTSYSGLRVEQWVRGKTQYELRNHLGNVLVTISDRKLGTDDDNDDLYDYYEADVLTANDYYPGGMEMPGRKWNNGSSYQYGFGGKRKDNEMYGEGNAYDFEARIFSPGLVRWLTVDPLAEIYPYQSPYVAMSNNLINRIDPTGMGDHYTKDGKHLGSDGKKVTIGKGKNAKQVGDNKAYVVSQADFDANTKNGVTNWDAIISSSGTKLLSVTNSDLQDLASSVYDESGGDRTESFALASTVINGSKTFKFTIGKFLAGQTSNYKGKKKYSVTGNGKFSMEAAINAASEGVDYSNGAVAWDGKDVFLWDDHYRYEKAAFDSRQGIFVPRDMMEKVMTLQFNLLEDYIVRGANSKQGVFSDYWISANNVYCNQMTNRTTTVEAGSLYRVTAVHGHSVFYRQVPVKSTSTEITRPVNFTFEPEWEGILRRLPVKKSK